MTWWRRVILFISPSYRFLWPPERQCHLIHLTILEVLMTSWKAVSSDISHHPRGSHYLMKDSVICFILPSWRFSLPHERQCHLIHLIILEVLITWWRQCHLIHPTILEVLITSWKAVSSDSSHHPEIFCYLGIEMKWIGL